MEISNEEQTRAMLAAWENLATPAQKKEISLAIQQLELNFMYYEQKGSSQGVARCERCIRLLSERLATLSV